MDNVTQIIKEYYAIYNDDCLEVMKKLPDKSIGMSIYSPPFAGLYHYSSSPRDLSNSRSYEEFLLHYDFVIREIARLTKPGRVTAVHCMDVPLSNSGKADFVMDFPGDIIQLHLRCRDPNCNASEWDKKHGLCGHGLFAGLKARYHIWKEPLAVRNRTMAKKLAHQTVVEDSIHCGVAGADYLLVFAAHGQNAEPITHKKGLQDYAGSQQIPSDVLIYKNWEGKQIENKYSHWIWRQYASSNWYDIRLSNVLPYQESKDPEDEKHVHPLQLDVIERAVILWSNPNDIVFTPFAGVGSEVYKPVELGRRAIGVELKRSYFKQMIMNMQMLENPEISEPTLFEFLADKENVNV